MRPWNIKLKCWWDGAFQMNGKTWQKIGELPDGTARIINISEYIEWEEATE